MATWHGIDAAHMAARILLQERTIIIKEALDLMGHQLDR